MGLYKSMREKNKHTLVVTSTMSKRRISGNSFPRWTITILLACGFFAASLCHERLGYFVASYIDTQLEPGSLPYLFVQSKTECASRCLAWRDCQGFGLGKPQNGENTLGCVLMSSSYSNVSTATPSTANSLYFDIFTCK